MQMQNNFSLLNDFTLATMLVLMIVMFVPSIKAEQTVKTIEQPFSYVSSTIPNYNYSITWNIDFPDGISEIQNYEIHIIGDFEASTTISGMIKETGTSIFEGCLPNSWTTPNVSTYAYRTIFDCSNKINSYDFKGGDIDLGFNFDKASKNTYGRTYMTYYNRPKPSISIFGTDYKREDNATVFLQLATELNVLNDQFCEVDIWYPNKTNYIDDTPMSYLNNSDGLYYYDLVVSLIE
jgi:hypothetical protein